METLLITGAGPRGVTGRLIKEYFEGKYKLLTPSSSELDLTNDEAVASYFDCHKVDYVIHCATFRPTSIHEGHFVDEELESNLRMFYALVAQSSRFKKMIYFGSGAEFDKSKPIVNIAEADFGRSVPKNKYGLGKYIMNMHTRTSDNIYNLRLFGTISRFERPEKNVVSNLCVKALRGQKLELRQDCKFSFMDVELVPYYIEYIIKHEIDVHDINLAIDKPYLLSEIANMIIEFNRGGEINFEKKGLNLEYTANTEIMNQKLPPPIPLYCLTVKAAVRKVYEHLRNVIEEVDISEIDNRWK